MKTKTENLPNSFLRITKRIDTLHGSTLKKLMISEEEIIKQLKRGKLKVFLRQALTKIIK